MSDVPKTPHKFDDELIARYRGFMRRTYEADFSTEEANLHLNSLARLFLAMSEPNDVNRIPSTQQENEIREGYNGGV